MGMNTDAVQRLYVAYFNRPADPVSLAVYESLLPSDRAATQAELQALADQYFSPSAEYQSLYAGMSNTQIVNQLYQNIFGREAEVDGLVYWAAELTAGRQSVASIALQLSYSAQGTDADVVANRIEAANAFTDGLNTSAEITGYSGDAAAASARSWLATVGSDAASKDAAIAGVDTAISDAVAASNPADPAQTFNLTTAVDTFTGGSGDDVFNADNTGTDTSSTADKLTGGEGTDTLNMFSDGNAAALPVLDSVETINFYDQDADVDLSGTQQASLTKATFTRGDGDWDATLGAAVASVSLSDMDVAAADIGITFGAARTDIALELSAVTGGTGDDIAVTATAVNTATVTVNSTSSVGGLDFGDAETVNIVANAKVTFVDDITTTDAAATLTITGAGAVDISAVDSGFTTINAADNTGGLTAELGGAVNTNLTGTGKNDVITASTTDTINTTDKLAVNAGGGDGDVLVIGDAADINTAADGARYTNFEIIRTADSQNMSLVAGVTALQITGGTSKTYSGMSATQLGNITFLADNTTATTFTAANATGSSDSITINLASATATTNIDLAGIGVDNIETVNFNVVTGTNTTGDSAITFGANLADEVSAINFTGGADTTLTVAANTLDVIPVTIDASKMTGTADFTLVQTSDLVAGSTVTGTDNGDTIALGTTTGSTYNGGGGADNFSTAVATLVATGTNDTKVNGGDGTDTLTITTTAATLTDNHFTFVTGMEKLVTSTGSTSITTGGSFNSAFQNGVTITTGTLADTSTFTYAGGLFSGNTTITVDGGSLVMDGAGEDITITTSSGTDTITVTTDATAVGAGGADGGSIVISTGAGDDKITFGYGTLTTQSTSQFATITGGTGADTIIKSSGTNGTVVTAVTKFVIGASDSTTTARDKITGFDLVENTGSLLGDVLDLPAATVATSVASEDFGVIQSHNLANGMITFDDAAAYATALTINSSNLSDVLGYLAANVTNNQTVAFLYDSNGDGVNDATMVFMNGATDILVELVGVTAAGVSATATTTTDEYIIIG